MTSPPVNPDLLNPYFLLSLNYNFFAFAASRFILCCQICFVFAFIDGFVFAFRLQLYLCIR